VKIGLGVCARDEGSTIVATLTSIVQSASFAAESCDWLLIVCANGCTDGTVQAVTEWIKNQAYMRISLCELEDANLVEAQRVIAARLTQQGADILGFFDGDILVAPH
jgi:glycosyltransferase involved in cell wall biosynthesis